MIKFKVIITASENIFTHILKLNRHFFKSFNGVNIRHFQLDVTMCLAGPAAIHSSQQVWRAC